MLQSQFHGLPSSCKFKGFDLTFSKRSLCNVEILLLVKLISTTLIKSLPNASFEIELKFELLVIINAFKFGIASKVCSSIFVNARQPLISSFMTLALLMKSEALSEVNRFPLRTSVFILVTDLRKLGTSIKELFDRSINSSFALLLKSLSEKYVFVLKQPINDKFLKLGNGTKVFGLISLIPEPSSLNVCSFDKFGKDVSSKETSGLKDKSRISILGVCLNTLAIEKLFALILLEERMSVFNLFALNFEFVKFNDGLFMSSKYSSDSKGKSLKLNVVIGVLTKVMWL